MDLAKGETPHEVLVSGSSKNTEMSPKYPGEYQIYNTYFRMMPTKLCANSNDYFGNKTIPLKDR